MKSAASTPRSSRRLSKIDVLEDSSINDEVWTCSVAMIVENHPDYKKYIKSFEEGFKNGNRPVIKLISVKDLESSTSRATNKPNLNKGVGKKTALDQSEKNSKGEQIRQKIFKFKTEDMYKLTNRNIILEKCEALKGDIDLDLIHDEPLCGPSLYIILTGFYDPDLVFELIKLQIPLDVILALEESESLHKDPDNSLKVEQTKDEHSTKKPKLDPHESFWQGYEDRLKVRSNLEITSDLIVFHCNPKEIFQGKENLKAKEINYMTYEYVCEQLYRVQTEKRKYVDFIRNIKTTTLDHINRLSVRELKQYCNSVRSVPIEATTVDYILNCLVLQIENDEQVAKTNILNEFGIPLNKSSKISLKTDLDGRKSSHTVEGESYVKGRKSSRSSDTAQVESDVKGRKSSRSSDTIEGESSTSFTNDMENESNYPTDQMVISSKTKLHTLNIPRTNMTPFVVEYKNQREFSMKGYQDYFEKFRDFHCKVLEGSICPNLWKLFPEIEGKERLYAKSHFQKVKHYFNIRENIILEASLHKRMFNKIILSSVDSRNIDAICHDVFEGYCGCGFDGSLSSTEEEEDQFRRNNRERANTHTTEKTYNTVDTNKTILSFNNNYFPLTRETLDFHAEEEEDEETKERVRKLNELILKNDKDLMDLKHFLNCPDLDNLFSKCYNAIEDYNILELYSKETCLNLLNHYCSTYEFIDYVYYSPTDCLIFVFHRNINENGFVNKSCEGCLLTPVGFRDYYNILLKHYPYLRWIQSRDKIIEKDNYDLMERFKVFLNEEDAGKCCFQKIHKYGIFPLNENMKSVYQSHAPIPPARTSEDETFTFIGYDMGTACHVGCSEDSKSFVSKLGLKVILKSFDYFDPLKVFNQVTFLNPTCSIFFEIPQVTEETTEPIQKAIIETEDGLRIVFTHKRKLIKNADGSRKSTLKSLRKNHPVHSGVKVESIDLEEVHHHEDELNEDNTVIVLPNGLELTIFKIKGEVWGLKQRHLEKSSRTPENLEKYRIYLKDGTVIVFMEGGTIKVYYSNTTITEITRVSSEKEFDDICGNETSDSNKYESNETNNKKHKGSYYVIGEHKVLTWAGMVKHFKFDFCSKCVAEYDLRTAFEPGTDLFTLRTDGTKSLLNSDGELVVQYPDGTRISSTPRYQILSEMQSDSQEFTSFEEKMQDEEWVLIDLDIHMEEPNNYVPVGYVGGIWIVSLPGDKKLSFRNSKSAVLSMVESELSLDHKRQLINFGMFQSGTFAFSNFTVYFSPEEDNAICKLVDDEDLFIIDTEGRMTLKESNFFEDERGIETLIDNFPRFSSGLTMIGPPPVEDKEKVAVPDVVSEDESLYAIKPSEGQQEFKMVYLRRDLTGCELIKDSEQKLLELRERCPGHEIYDKTEYRNRSCKITLWNLLPEGQIFPADTTTKLPYLNPQCFSMTNLQRKNLTKLLPKTRVWLFDTADCKAINKPMTSLCDLRKTSIPSVYPKKTNRAVTMSRRHIDLNEFDGFDSMLEKALNLYLKYKKDIYRAILKNTIDEIKNKQDEPQEKISDRPKISFFRNM